MRIPIRTSRWAIWARRLAGLALPFEIIPVVLHHQRMIPSDTFTFLFAGGLLLAVLALLVSLIALIRLWRTGFRGWPQTLQAIIIGLIALAPLGVAIYWSSIYPPTNDVATAGAVPPLRVSDNMHQLLSQAETARVFPAVVARSYPMPPDQVFALVDRLVSERRWETRIKRQPVAPSFPGSLHALAVTWLGFRDEVAILVEARDDGSMVSARSASTFGWNDLGANGRRLEEFLTALDAAVIEAQRQGPVIDEGSTSVDDTGADAPE